MKVIPFRKVESFLTEEEAEGKLSDKHMETIFCPLIKDMCRTDCVCYAKSFVYDNKMGGVTRYMIQEGYCDNDMFATMEE